MRTRTHTPEAADVARADCHYRLRVRLNNFTRRLFFLFFFYFHKCRSRRYSRRQLGGRDVAHGPEFDERPRLFVNLRDTRPAAESTAQDPRVV